MAGCGGAGSTRETIQYVKEAAKAGAECVLVISPGYYKFAFGTTPKQLKQCTRFSLRAVAIRPLLTLVFFLLSLHRSRAL